MRESRTLEYKENLSSNTFLKTISAYANYGEGKIIFGINDQGNIIGITDPVNGCLNLENKINDSLSPVPEFRLEIQEIRSCSLFMKAGISLISIKVKLIKEMILLQLKWIVWNITVDPGGCNQTLRRSLHSISNLLLLNWKQNLSG